jgi:hypothetical protein
MCDDKENIKKNKERKKPNFIHNGTAHTFTQQKLEMERITALAKVNWNLNSVH